MWCHICCFALMIDAVWYTRRMCMKKLRWKSVNVKNWSKEKTVCCLLAILIQNFQKPNQTLEVKRRKRLQSNVLAASCLPLWESLFETGLSQTARFSSKGKKQLKRLISLGLCLIHYFATIVFKNTSFKVQKIRHHFSVQRLWISENKKGNEYKICNLIMIDTDSNCGHNEKW